MGRRKHEHGACTKKIHSIWIKIYLLYVCLNYPRIRYTAIMLNTHTPAAVYAAQFRHYSTKSVTGSADENSHRRQCVFLPIWNFCTNAILLYRYFRQAKYVYVYQNEPWTISRIFYALLLKNPRHAVNGIRSVSSFLLPRLEKGCCNVILEELIRP